MVDVYRKGHSTKCMYTSTSTKATVTVEKIKRCSDRGSYTADMISKVWSDDLLIEVIIMIMIIIIIMISAG